MYSRNTSKKSAGRVAAEEKESREEYRPINISAPPNYCGMLYDIGKDVGKNDILAEGIERLVSNDPLYGRFECKKTNERPEKHPAKEQGIEKIVDGLKNSSFLPEDLLICALIILMLNAGSEDDMLLILVLMMLF